MIDEDIDSDQIIYRFGNKLGTCAIRILFSDVMRPGYIHMNDGYQLEFCLHCRMYILLIINRE